MTLKALRSKPTMRSRTSRIQLRLVHHLRHVVALTLLCGFSSHVRRNGSPVAEAVNLDSLQ